MLSFKMDKQHRVLLYNLLIISELSKLGNILLFDNFMLSKIIANLLAGFNGFISTWESISRGD